jgi:ADP-ribosylglycohydrolase
MRVSPIGAYYFDDLKQVKELAIKSAEITHSNIEGITEHTPKIRTVS